MAWNGSGTYSRTNGTNTGATLWNADAAAGTKITTARHDTHDEDIATAITACLTKNNESKPTADFLPNVDASYDLGGASNQWVNAYLSGNVIIDAITQPKIPAQVSGHIRAGNTQLLSGAAAVTGVTLSTLMVSGTEETFGPTGSGATNIWAGIDVIPSTATILIVGLNVQIIQDATVTAGTVSVFASNGDDASYATGDANIIGLAKSYTASTADRDGVDTYTVCHIPLGPTNQDFYLEYVSANCSPTIQLYYLGFMTD